MLTSLGATHAPLDGYLVAPSPSTLPTTQTPWAFCLQGTCRRSGLPVALKVYFLSRVPSNVLHMVVREIKIHSELTHKNIVALYAAFQVWVQPTFEGSMALSGS